MNPIISGIQQLGIGVTHVQEAFTWYRQNFGMDIPVFEEAAEAALMLPYTGGQPRKRHAILALNIQGGGGMEIWQYIGRDPYYPKNEVQLGDLGIAVGKIKCKDVVAFYNKVKTDSPELLLGTLSKTPAGTDHFFMKDMYGNLFEIVPVTDFFKKTNHLCGGVYGAALGVSDMEKSMHFYAKILGYDKVVYDEEGTFEDLVDLPGGTGKLRRVLLQHSLKRKGGFSRMLGNSEIELFKVLDRKPNKIYEDRFWGDPGFIHLCFDINGMDKMKALCESNGHPFTVDSKDSFDMGEAAGHFTYIEDPDGTLIEFVETHKIPILKKINWYLDLRKRNPEKPLPNWMLKALALNRVK